MLEKSFEDNSAEFFCDTLWYTMFQLREYFFLVSKY